MYTCPRLESAHGSSPAPLPVSISFFAGGEEEGEAKDGVDSGDAGVVPRRLRMSVLYTNSQVAEWTFSSVDDAYRLADQWSLLSLRAKSSHWLLKFWRAMGDEVLDTLGVFHSHAYIPTKRAWLLASDRYMVILTHGGVSRRLSSALAVSFL